MPGKAHKAEVYQDSLGEWRWRARARNGEVIADSGEGYVSRSHAVEMAEDVTGVPATMIERPE
jgi:uncharacterized protein YegP (UPF0339 family)